MEKEMDTLKVGKHPQVTRLISEKEDDDVWISSEDLRTEGSSEDDDDEEKESQNSESVTALKSKRSRRNKTAEIPQKQLEEHMDSEPCCSKIIRDVSSAASGRVVGDLDIQLLSLENHWRPKRGSLTLPTLIAEGQTKENFLHEVTSFHSHMMDQVSLLKKKSNKNHFPILNSHLAEAPEKLFKYLKFTPQVKEQLHFIKKLDDDITETIAAYKREKAKRLEVEYEMCQMLHNENVRNSEVFLDLCQFTVVKAQDSPDETPIKFSEPPKVHLPEVVDRKFVEKNIQLAKEGNMAYGLTDEEKQQLNELLKEDDDDNGNENQDEDYDLEHIGNVTHDLSDSDSDEVNEASTNSFTLSKSDMKRMEEIGQALDKLMEKREEETDEKAVKNSNNEKFWQQYLSQQALKDIDAKLDALAKERAEENKEIPKETNDKLESNDIEDLN